MFDTAMQAMNQRRADLTNPVKQTIRVALTHHYYFCIECKTEHEFKDDIYLVHKEYALDYGRWHYEVIK
jgi:hypothetical protein